MFKYYYLHPYNQTSRLIDKSEQKEVNNMNNHSHHDHNEPLYDGHPFEGLIERALLHQHQQDESTYTAQHRSAIPEYRITIEHGSIRIRQECAASAGV